MGAARVDAAERNSQTFLRTRRPSRSRPSRSRLRDQVRCTNPRNRWRREKAWQISNTRRRSTPSPARRMASLTKHASWFGSRRPTPNSAGWFWWSRCIPAARLTYMFEFTSIYSMTSGHAAVDVVTGGLQQVIDSNPERYKDLRVAQGQTNEILAQVGSLIKSKMTGPFAGLPVRKIILAGTSATAAMLIQYLPAHMVYRTP